jgi:hypothetical protein
METLLKAQETPISDTFIRHYLPNTQVITYEQLGNYSTITELLPNKKDAVVLLFLTAENFGHFCCILRNRNKILFFDSYKFRPDKQLLFIDKHERKQLNQEIPHLSYLLNQALKNGMMVTFSETQFQNINDPNIATCGRYCIAIIQYWFRTINPSLKGFYNYFKKLQEKYELTNDLLVSKIVPDY